MKKVAASNDWRYALRILQLFVCFALAACRATHEDARQQHAYVWSRENNAASLHLPEAVTGLRVLAAQWTHDESEPWVLRSALPRTSESARPIVVVVRLDGHAITVPPTSVAETLRAQWPRWAAGQQISAVEIDHDSATSRLGDYASWLVAFRGAWGGVSPVWITALPDWRHSNELANLLDAADSYTLQVHAIDAKSPSLVDAPKALEWVTQFERISDTPHFVALPTYALRVGLGGDGEVRFIEAENRIGATAAHERMLFADPVELALLAKRLRETRTANRHGIAWFRLPDAQQRNAMSRDTFDLLVAGGVPDRNVVAVATPVRPSASTFDVVLVNEGRHDTGLPRSVHLAQGCEAGDVASSFRAASNRQTLNRIDEGLLRSGESKSVGWIRCESSTSGSLRVGW